MSQPIAIGTPAGVSVAVRGGGGPGRARSGSLLQRPSTPGTRPRGRSRTEPTTASAGMRCHSGWGQRAGGAGARELRRRPHRGRTRFVFPSHPSVAPTAGRGSRQGVCGTKADGGVCRGLSTVVRRADAPGRAGCMGILLGCARDDMSGSGAFPGQGNAPTVGGFRQREGRRCRQGRVGDGCRTRGSMSPRTWTR